MTPPLFRERTWLVSLKLEAPVVKFIHATRNLVSPTIHFFSYILWFHYSFRRMTAKEKQWNHFACLKFLSELSFHHGLSRVLFRLVSSVAGARRLKSAWEILLAFSSSHTSAIFFCHLCIIACNALLKFPFRHMKVKIKFNAAQKAE